MGAVEGGVVLYFAFQDGNRKLPQLVLKERLQRSQVKCVIGACKAGGGGRVPLRWRRWICCKMVKLAGDDVVKVFLINGFQDDAYKTTN
eukprot:5614727-Amphidinium_carterae.8